jgi:release factor glutamine methyltransferase
VARPAGGGLIVIGAPDAAALVRRLRAAGCVFAEDEAALLLEAAGDPRELDALAARREAGEPLEQVLGWVGFCGLRVAVAPGVFVPRQRTALLVRLATARARPGTVVLDLCCGTGALGAAVASAVPGVQVHAADVDPAAVACARRNLAPFGGRVVEGDLFDPLPGRLRGQVGVLLANVPYVPTAAIAGLPPEARDHEPRRALDGGPDGLALLQRVADAAPRWLAPGGVLLTEAGADQAPGAAAVLRAAGLAAEVVEDDDLGATAVLATAPGRGRTAAPDLTGRPGAAGCAGR